MNITCQWPFINYYCQTFLNDQISFIQANSNNWTLGDLICMRMYIYVLGCWVTSRRTYIYILGREGVKGALPSKVVRFSISKVEKNWKGKFCSCSTILALVLTCIIIMGQCKMQTVDWLRAIVFMPRKQWDYYCHVRICVVETIVRSLRFTLTLIIKDLF